MDTTVSLFLLRFCSDTSVQLMLDHESTTPQSQNLPINNNQENAALDSDLLIQDESDRVQTTLEKTLSKIVTSDGAADTSAPGGQSNSSTPPSARGAAVTPVPQTRRARPRLHARPRQEGLRSHPFSRHDRQREGTPGRRGQQQKVLQTKRDHAGNERLRYHHRHPWSQGPSVHLLKCQ